MHTHSVNMSSSGYVCVCWYRKGDELVIDVVQDPFDDDQAPVSTTTE